MSGRKTHRGDDFDYNNDNDNFNDTNDNNGNDNDDNVDVVHIGSYLMVAELFLKK